jgi:hypothetical protein
MLPTVKLCNTTVSRLIVGGNPISGNSHVSSAMDNDMMDYYTTERVLQTLHHCEKQGISTMQLRGDKHITRILREFRASGGRMNWIAQTASEINFDSNIRQIVAAGAAAIYLHGTIHDDLFKKKDYTEILRRLAVMRATGLPVGLGTHIPAAIEYAEEHQWDVDFYMACVYNISREDRVSSAITGIANAGEPFYEEDIPVMYKMIRQTSKPCLAFKILGATRRCATQDTVRAAFDEAYASIKPGDCVVVGMYPKDLDQVGLNCAYASDAIAKTQKTL